MAKESIFCISKNESQTEMILNQLRSSGFSNNDISDLFPDRTGNKDFAHEKHSKAPEGAVAGGAIGALIGGLAGWFLGSGGMAVAGLGFFVAAGPVLAALSGAAIVAAVMGVAGAFIGAGIPEYEAKR